MMRLTMILLVLMAQVTLSGHCIHNFFECNHSLGEEDRGGRPVREVYSAATSVTLSVGVVAMMIARILI